MEWEGDYEYSDSLVCRPDQFDDNIQILSGRNDRETREFSLSTSGKAAEFRIRCLSITHDCGSIPRKAEMFLLIASTDQLCSPHGLLYAGCRWTFSNGVKRQGNSSALNV